MPVAVAILLTFLLDPVVRLLQRSGPPPDARGDPGGGRGLRAPGRALAGWSRGSSPRLANDLPHHTENLQHKLADLRGMGHGGVIEKVQQTIEAVLREPRQAPPAAAPRVRSGRSRNGLCPSSCSRPRSSGSCRRCWSPWRAPAWSLVLVIFMLLKPSDLRNRLIRLAGYSQLTTATKALDDAGQRISRYLLMQWHR